MPDREKVIKGLEICVNMVPGKYDCYKCPYEIDGSDCEINSTNDAIALLKEQPEIVRCKDCKHWSAERINDYNKCKRWINVGVNNFATMGDWFCADGERRTDDA